MNRITARTPSGTAVVLSDRENEGVGYYTTQRRLPELISRLTAYEDTGMTPDEIAAMKRAQEGETACLQ